MNNVLREYIDHRFAYKFTHGPHVVRTRDEALRAGINCVSLAHLALRDLFHYELPPDLQCFEMYRDRRRFQPVNGLGAMQTGDLLWFGTARPQTSPEDFTPRYDPSGNLANWAEFPINHVALYSGEDTASGEPLLLHASDVEGTTALWPISKFAEHVRYSKLYAVTRLQVAAHCLEEAI